MAKPQKRWGPWVYNPRPKGWPPVQNPTHGRLRKLEKLALECEQNGDRVYRLGTSFQMTLAPELQAKLDGTESTEVVDNTRWK